MSSTNRNHHKVSRRNYRRETHNLTELIRFTRNVKGSPDDFEKQLEGLLVSPEGRI